MKEYPKLRLIAARTRTEVIQEQYPEDKFLSQVTQRIIEDINASIVFDEMEIPNEASKKISI